MMLNIRLFSFGPTAPWHVCTRKRGSTGKKSFRQCIDLATVGLAEVGQRSEWSVAIMAAWQEIRCCPNTRLPQISSLTSLYECGSHFRAEEKSAAISLIPPRGPDRRPSMGTSDQSNQEGGEPFFLSDHLSL